MSNEYISRQAAIDDICETANDFQDVLIPVYYMGLIKALPAADVVPVVRCKDCKHYYFADNRIPQEQRYVCEISGEIWKPDDFCSYGERKE